MSNNPFRRSQVVKPSDPLPPVDHAQDLDLEPDARPATPPKRSKQKRVQIQTPPHSPEAPFLAEDGNRRLSASSGRTNSPPPPPVTIAGDDSASDSSVAAEPALEQARINARRNSATFDPPGTTHPPPQSGVRAPYNPFARTLATSEASFGPQRGGSEEQEQASTEQPRASSRPAMDVDMFKNILLTGSAPPPTATGAASALHPTRSQASSAGTDASSISRQSLFDSGGEYRSESPRTSFDDYASASSDEEDREQDNASLMGPNRPQELAPPAPPKPKARGPQTVSFAEFDQSIPSQYEPTAPQTPSTYSISDISRPSPLRSGSDLNKPLPAPPDDSEKGPVTTFPSAVYTSSPDDPTHPKKIPPPPPTSRRRAARTSKPRRRAAAPQGSATTATGEADSDSEDYDSGTDSDNDAAESFVKIAPPPPPARKAQPHPHNSTNSPNRPLSTDVSKAMPPPPPRRQPSRSGSHASGGSARPSFESTRPAAQLRDPPSSSAGPSAAAPPVPPPRRGAATGSKRESLDGAAPPSLRSASIESGSRRRVSAQSAESPRSASLAVAAAAPAAPADPSASSPSSLLAREKAPASNAAAVEVAERDLLADLTAFQAEIDALRAKAGSSG